MTTNEKAASVGGCDDGQADAGAMINALGPAVAAAAESRPWRVIPRRLVLLGDPVERHVRALANVAARMFEASGHAISEPVTPLDVAREPSPAKGAILSCALELRGLLLESAQGRQALSDLGFEPVLQHIEGE